VLPRLSYLAVSSMFTVIRLLPTSDTANDIEILALRHQLAILQPQIDRPPLTGTDRVFLTALLHRLPKVRLRQLHLIVSPHTVLRWHRDLIRRRHTKISRHQRPGRVGARNCAPAMRPAHIREQAAESVLTDDRRVGGQPMGGGGPERCGLSPGAVGSVRVWSSYSRRTLIACGMLRMRIRSSRSRRTLPMNRSWMALADVITVGV
jgi:hypothetical protein